MKKLLEKLKTKENLEKIVVLTGSGISAESGISTFRDNDGLWNNYNIEDVATYSGFAKDPEMVWKFYDQRRQEIQNTKPNKGHYALFDLETHLQKKNKEFLLFTQNVDGLHYMAGNRNIYELHGNLWDAFCINCKKKRRLNDVPLRVLPPKCESCKNLMRPDVVWFGEQLPSSVLDKGFESMDCDILMVIGTSLLVYPVAYFPFLALKNKSLIIEINTEKTHASDYFSFVKGKAGEVLPEIINNLKEIL